MNESNWQLAIVGLEQAFFARALHRALLIVIFAGSTLGAEPSNPAGLDSLPPHATGKNREKQAVAEGSAAKLLESRLKEEKEVVFIPWNGKLHGDFSECTFRLQQGSKLRMDYVGYDLGFYFGSFNIVNGSVVEAQIKDSTHARPYIAWPRMVLRRDGEDLLLYREDGNTWWHDRYPETGKPSRRDDFPFYPNDIDDFWPLRATRNSAPPLFGLGGGTRSEELGFGFRLQNRDIDRLPQYFYLLYQSQELCRVGPRSISPSGRFAIYQELAGGNLFLFRRADRKIVQLTPKPIGLPLNFVWHERDAAVVVHFIGKTKPRTFALPSLTSVAAGPGWKRTLSKVRVGMRRAAVERILARHGVMLDFDLDPAIKTKVEKGGRTSLYLLDDQWCAAITFGSSFTTRNNPYLVLHLPDNKVLAPPHLLRRTVELNKVIERAQ